MSWNTIHYCYYYYHYYYWPKKRCDIKRNETKKQEKIKNAAAQFYLCCVLRMTKKILIRIKLSVNWLNTLRITPTTKRSSDLNNFHIFFFFCFSVSIFVLSKELVNGLNVHHTPRDSSVFFLFFISFLFSFLIYKCLMVLLQENW